MTKSYTLYKPTEDDLKDTESASKPRKRWTFNQKMIPVNGSIVFRPLVNQIKKRVKIFVPAGILDPAKGVMFTLDPQNLNAVLNCSLEDGRSIGDVCGNPADHWRQPVAIWLDNEGKLIDPVVLEWSWAIHQDYWAEWDPAAFNPNSVGLKKKDWSYRGPEKPGCDFRAKSTKVGDKKWPDYSVVKCEADDCFEFTEAHFDECASVWESLEKAWRQEDSLATVMDMLKAHGADVAPAERRFADGGAEEEDAPADFDPFSEE